MTEKNLAEMPDNVTAEVKASAVATETEAQKIVVSNVNDNNKEGDNPPPKGGSADVEAENKTETQQQKPEDVKSLTFEDIVKSHTLSPEQLDDIIKSASNDNLFSHAI